jgi:hypothetical protein
MNLKISVEVVDDHGRCRQCKRRIISDRVVCDVDRVVPRHDLDFAGHQRLVRALHFKFDEMMNARTKLINCRSYDGIDRKNLYYTKLGISIYLVGDVAEFGAERFVGRHVNDVDASGKHVIDVGIGRAELRLDVARDDAPTTAQSLANRLELSALDATCEAAASNADHDEGRASVVAQPLPRGRRRRVALHQPRLDVALQRRAGAMQVDADHDHVRHHCKAQTSSLRMLCRICNIPH